MSVTHRGLDGQVLEVAVLTLDLQYVTLADTLQRTGRTEAVIPCCRRCNVGQHDTLYALADEAGVGSCQDRGGVVVGIAVATSYSTLWMEHVRLCAVHDEYAVAAVLVRTVVGCG